jgi:hypothetical protein
MVAEYITASRTTSRALTRPFHRSAMAARNATKGTTTTPTITIILRRGMAILSSGGAPPIARSSRLAARENYVTSRALPGTKRVEDEEPKQTPDGLARMKAGRQ